MENINEEFKDGRRKVDPELFKKRFPNYKKPSGVPDEIWKKYKEEIEEISKKIKKEIEDEERGNRK